MSVRLSHIEGRDLRGKGAEPIGRVRHVLFHPSEPRAVGLMVDPPRMGGVVKRAPSYLGLGQLSMADDDVSAPLKKLPPGSKGEELLGHDPDRTVIWSAMPVVASDDVEVGSVSDVSLDPSSGEIGSLLISAGATSDVAVGGYTVPAREVDGYARGAVRLSVPFSHVESQGGLAEKTGKAAAVVSVHGGRAASAAGDAVVRASGEAGRTIRRVREEGVTGAAKGMWAELTEAFREGYDEDDEDH